MRVFHAPTSGGLHLCAIRGSDGEIGLKANSAETYFGLIYIGDSPAFRNLAASDDSGIVLVEDAISKALFDDINSPSTTINVLIGAKKFMEGWDSYRVSNMGLLNAGTSEGSEIIQLFGRGVRLRGKDRSLRRNLSRGTGVGFFESSGFYPDFLLWIKETGRQRIVFIEPHGMIHAEAYDHDEKAQLHNRLPELARKIGERSGRYDITLDSYIISATQFQHLHKRYDDGTWDLERFAEAHILFAEHSDYLNRIFEAQPAT